MPLDVVNLLILAAIIAVVVGGCIMTTTKPSDSFHDKLHRGT